MSDLGRRQPGGRQLSEEAGNFRDRARRVLAAEHPAPSCATPERPTPPTSPAASAADVSPPRPPAVRVRPPGVTIAGGILLGVAGLSAVALAGVQIHRAGAMSELDGLLDELHDASGKTTTQAQQIEHLRGVERRTDAATTGLGVSLGVLAALGVSLTIWGRRQSGPTRRARLSPHGRHREIGVVFTGHF